ncbi:hypothetical protein CWI38_0444p0030 [Hamiltosporidium tvaerminnensis]|uniref:Uncharacterized protein n=1 Tax=Hamiltosporidium tvaerminnensis TaxID=1176355 RepID=A0A4Q9M011_9MICR|nr:hypothetical protein CWI38_0444p0030 [Hamiltosporidium tvaerminnensis]
MHFKTQMITCIFCYLSLFTSVMCSIDEEKPGSESQVLQVPAIEADGRQLLEATQDTEAVEPKEAVESTEAVKALNIEDREQETKKILDEVKEKESQGEGVVRSGEIKDELDRYANPQGYDVEEHGEANEGRSSPCGPAL